MFDVLPGLKTYIVVVCIIAGVISEKVFGITVPGFEVGPEWLETVLFALGLGTLRKGVSNPSGS